MKKKTNLELGGIYTDDILPCPIMVLTAHKYLRLQILKEIYHIESLIVRFSQILSVSLNLIKPLSFLITVESSFLSTITP